MEIGQVVRVDTASDWLVEIFRENDIESPPDRPDYSVGTFLKTPADDSELVCVVRDIMIYNPDYGIPHVKAEEREGIEEIMPDLGDQVKTLIFVYYLGKMGDGTPDHSFPSITPRLHDEIETMEDEEIRSFHKREGELYVGYLPRFLEMENSSYIFDRMADRVDGVIEEDRSLLRKIRRDVTVGAKIGGGLR